MSGVKKQTIYKKDTDGAIQERDIAVMGVDFIGPDRPLWGVGV